MSLSARAARLARESIAGFALVTIVAIALLTVAIRLVTHVIAPRLLAHAGFAPALAVVPRRTENAAHQPADPVNVALVGTAQEVSTALRAAGWVPADTLDRVSKLGIARSVVFRRPYPTAPVSPLFLYGRQQDAAFEREVGGSARERHHVRLWFVPGVAIGGRPVWIGDATFDKSAGLSYRGLRPTHHIAADVDQERDTLVADLARVGQVAAWGHVSGMGPRVMSHNAEGDRFDTDGEMAVVTIPTANAPRRPTPPPAPDPPLVALKNRVWTWAHRHL